MKKTIEKPPRHLPQRTCAACRQVKQKRDLVRLVRTAEGSVKVDEKGRQPGRGAYLCRDRACWENGLKNNRLEVVLKCRLTPADRQLLAEYKEQL